MFGPAEMSEVDIFVFENDVQDVAQVVASLGAMHLLDANALGKWAEGMGTEWVGRISAYASQERRATELLSQLGVRDVPYDNQDKIRPADDLVELEEELDHLEASTRGLREEATTLRDALERWELVSKSMETLAPLSVSISDLRSLEHLHLVVGTIPSENLARLEASLFRIPYTIIPVYHQRQRVLVFAFCAQEHAAILDRALESAFLDPLALPEEFGGTPHDVLEQMTQHTNETRAQLADVEAKRKRLADEIGPSILQMLSRIRRNRAIAEAMSHFGHRGRVYLIAGWVPKARVQELRTAVEQVAGGRVTFEENSPYMPGERLHRIPTLLKNRGILRPFEGLVRTYGTPDYQEIDPTPLVAITFVLMFGIMFGDLGHGLVLALLGLVLVSRIIPRLAGQASLGWILVVCGLSSSVFGVLYGSVFGLEDLIPSLWIKPMKSIWTLLGASIVFGVLVLNIGFICHLITAIREGQFVDAIFDKNGIAGMGLYWGLMGLVLSVALRRPLPLWLEGIVVILLVVLFMAEPLANLLRGVRPLIHGNVGEYAVQAFFEVFEALISYVSNTLSYVRLGAFAVAHVGLTNVVLLLANMLSSGPSGGILRALVIVAGNLFVVGFEGLIVSIQTLRLEYYELFGKFFKGEGIPFRPLTLPSVEGRTGRPSGERSK